MNPYFYRSNQKIDEIFMKKYVSKLSGKKILQTLLEVGSVSI